MHAMLDLETLGLTVGKAITEIGAVKFSYGIDGVVYDKDYFSAACRLDEHNMDFDPSTISWWMCQENNERVAAAIEHGIPLQDALIQFKEWCELHHITHVWAKPSSFDIAMIENAFSRCGIKPSWHYRNVRDTRTLFSLWAQLTGGQDGDEPYIDWNDLGLTPHVAYHDAIGQAIQATMAIHDLLVLKES